MREMAGSFRVAGVGVYGRVVMVGLLGREGFVVAPSCIHSLFPTHYGGITRKRRS
ncbi:hypothetical protein GCM10008949_10820 [Deinococcus humi]|nr:hypothetical protein GCM10008949_10820 [Deinococcus humi]